MIHLATNKHKSRIIVSRGLTACANESSGLYLRGWDDASPLLDSIDSKQMIKSSMASQRYFSY